MKKIIAILLLIVSMGVSAQHSVERDNPYFPQPVRIIATNALAVSLNAVGDGLRDRAWQYHDPTLSKWGHACVAGSVLTTLTIPLGQGFEWNDWLWYLASYTFMRVAIFDPIYNVTRGFEWDYRGNSSNWDLLLNNHIKAPDGEIMLRGVSFALAISIPLNQWHLKKY